MAGERLLTKAGAHDPVRPVNDDHRVAFGAGRMLLIRQGSPCSLCMQTPAGEQPTVHLDAGDHLVASPHHTEACLSLARAFQPIDENRLCRMLAFVDTALGVPDDPERATQSLATHAIAPDIAARPEALELWLALEVMRGESKQALFTHLRRQEAYQLTGYLLNTPPGDSAQLNQLCVRYGLSYSHFRRLCHRALGGAAKPRLRVWRATRALLDLMDGGQPILKVALENGYTSASHISIDIKQLFGVTPRMAKNAQALLP